MLQYIDAEGRIVARDDVSLATILDTNDGNLFVDLADYFSGSVTLPARSASSSGVDGTQNIVDLTAEYYVATPSSPSANIALGHLRRSTDAAWRQAFGTHVLDLDAVGNTLVPQTDLVGQTYLATVRAVTPLINPLGHLVIRERTIIRPRDPGSPPAITKTLPAVTLDYRLFCGSWWGNPFQAPRADADLRYGSHLSMGANPLYTNVNAGYPYAGRRLVLVLQNARSSANLLSATIGGVSATIHGSAATANTRTVIASAIVETGEAVTVSFSWSSSPGGAVALGLYAVRSLTGDPPTLYTAATASGTQQTLALPETDGATAIVLSTRAGGASSTCAWSGANEVFDQVSFSTSAHSASAAVVDGIPAGDVTGAWTGSPGEISMLAAVFT